MKFKPEERPATYRAEKHTFFKSVLNPFKTDLINTDKNNDIMKFKSEERPSAITAENNPFLKLVKNPFEIDLIHTEKMDNNSFTRKIKPQEKGDASSRKRREKSVAKSEEKLSAITAENNPFLKLVKNPFEIDLIDTEKMDNNPFTRKIKPQEKGDASSRKRREKSVTKSEINTKNNILEVINDPVIIEITSKQLMSELKSIKNHFTKVQEKSILLSNERNIEALLSQLNNEEKEIFLPQNNDIWAKEAVPVKYVKVSNENNLFIEKDESIRVLRQVEVQENNPLNIIIQLDKNRVSSKSSSHSSKNDRIAIPKDISKRSAKKIAIPAVEKKMILDEEAFAQSDWFPRQESVCLLQDESHGEIYQMKGYPKIKTKKNCTKKLKRWFTKKFNSVFSSKKKYIKLDSNEEEGALKSPEDALTK